MLVRPQIVKWLNHCALAVALTFLVSLTAAQAQQTGGTGGGNTGGATGGATGGGAGGGSVSGLQDSDTIFADGVARSGPAVQSQIGAAPGNTGGTSVTLGGGRSSGGLFGGLSGLGGFGGLSSLFGGASQQTQRSVRTRLVSRISTPPTAPAVLQSRVATTFSQIAAKPRFSGIRVEMEGTTAILIGSVTNADDKRMATLLAQLEPGIREVRNELEVAP